MVALLNERNADVIFRPRSASTILKVLRCDYKKISRKGTAAAVAQGGRGFPSSGPTARADTEGSGDRTRPGGDSKARLPPGRTGTRVGPAPSSASPTPTSWQPDDSAEPSAQWETSPLRVAGPAARATSASGAPRFVLSANAGFLGGVDWLPLGLGHAQNLSEQNGVVKMRRLGIREAAHPRGATLKK